MTNQLRPDACRKSLSVLTLMFVFTLTPFVGISQGSTDDWTQVPGEDWAKVKPESVGFSSERLQALAGWLKTQQTTAMLVAVHGQIIFEYGDLKATSKVASIRKSILAMLYGRYVVSGKINLDRTVKDLGLDDMQPFLPIEEHATLEQLLASSSGVYLPNGSAGQDEATLSAGLNTPERTSSTTIGTSMPPERCSKN